MTNSIVPTKILTVEDCELRIKKNLESLENPESDLLEEDEMHLAANIQIFEHVKESIQNGAIITLDINETFGWWGDQGQSHVPAGPGPSIRSRKYS